MNSQDPALLALFDYSANYFCIICKKNISDSVRIVALVEKQKSVYYNFCPPCLCSQNNPYSIVQYMVIDQQPSLKFKKIPTKEVAETISYISKNGIESVINNPQCPYVCQKYEQINKKLFKGEKMYVPVQDSRYDPNRYTPFVKPKNPNRKHLQNLGFCWQRNQFSYLPQAIYDYLLGSYDQDQALVDSDQKLMSVLVKYQAREKGQIQKIQNYLVNSNYLQSKKVVSSETVVPRQIRKLTQMQEPIKELFSCASSFMQDHKPRQLVKFNAWKSKKQAKQQKKQEKALLKNRKTRKGKMDIIDSDEMTQSYHRNDDKMVDESISNGKTSVSSASKKKDISIENIIDNVEDGVRTRGAMKRVVQN